MKKIISLCLSIAISVIFVCGVFAQTWVNGYTRRDGTYVSGHYRSSPNSTVRDNYSYYGNRNPYTGRTGTNRYRNNPTSEWYGSSSNSSSSNWGW